MCAKKLPALIGNVHVYNQGIVTFSNIIVFYNTFAVTVMEMSHNMRFPTIWYVRPAKAQTSLRIRAD